MHSINFDKYFNFLNWSCIYWGIHEQLIEPENAVLYANKVIEINPDISTPEIVELLILEENEKEIVLSLIEKIIDDKKELMDKKNDSLRALRFVLLLELQKNATNNQTLLDAIDEVYADFDYPQDMEAFISYMPVQDDGYDVSAHSSEENVQRLIQNFNNFLDRERKQITKEG